MDHSTLSKALDSRQDSRLYILGSRIEEVGGSVGRYSSINAIIFLYQIVAVSGCSQMNHSKSNPDILTLQGQTKHSPPLLCFTFNQILCQNTKIPPAPSTLLLLAIHTETPTLPHRRWTIMCTFLLPTFKQVWISGRKDVSFTSR